MNKHWKIKDGKMVKKPRFPKAKRTDSTSVAGLTLSHTVTKSFKFSVAQLKDLCTAEKLVGASFTRDQIKELLQEITRQNRYVIFESFAPYTITYNGYGQLKSMQLKEFGHKLSVDEIFNRLDKEFLTAEV